MNAKSMLQSTQGMPSIVAAAGDHGIAQARRHLGLAQPLGVGPQIGERERVGGAQSLRDRDEAAGIGQLLDALLGTDREVMAAHAADPQQLAQLVLAVMRVADRARVGVRPCAGRRLLARRLLALHLYLDVFGLLVAGHRPPPRPPYRERADADSS